MRHYPVSSISLVPELFLYPAQGFSEARQNLDYFHGVGRLNTAWGDRKAPTTAECPGDDFSTSDFLMQHV